MDERTTDRLGAATGLTATLSVGAGVLYASLAGDVDLRPDAPLLWWTAYAVYVAAFAVHAEAIRPARRPSDRTLLAVEVVAGIAVWLLAPLLGWTAVLLVTTAATAAWTVTKRAVLVLVVAQTVLVAVGTAAAGGSTFQTVLTTVVYGSFQAFAALVVLGERQQAEARAELAATHAELEAAVALLASSTRDAERLRIARDLHDLVGHQLTALTLELEVAEHHADGPAAEHVGRARTISKELLGDVREVVSELRTRRGGLEETLRALVADVPSLEVDLHVVEDVPLDEARAIAVVRCVQEVVTNTVRHARARRLAIDVRAGADGVTIQASDDGSGAVQVRPGNGLTGMRERIEQLGGRLDVRSAAGDGFRVAARLPAP